MCCRDRARRSEEPLTWEHPKCRGCSAGGAHGGRGQSEPQDLRPQSGCEGPASEDPRETQGPRATLKTKGFLLYE